MSEPSLVATQRETKNRAGRYAALAVGLSFLGNLVHFLVKVDWGNLNDVLAVGTEALFGPMLVLIASHLLLHTRREMSIETATLWASFVCGALLSSVHLYGIAALVGVGPEVEVFGAGFHPLALLLPVGVEGASIGSIRQYARVRQALDDTETAAIAARVEAVEAEERAQREADAAACRQAQIAEAEAELTRERKRAAEAVVKARKVSAGKTTAEDTETAVATFLAANAEDRDGKGPTLKHVADSLGVTTRTVQRTEAWKTRDAEPVAALEVVA